MYTAHAGDNTKFVYIPKMEQKANFVYKELYSIRKEANIFEIVNIWRHLNGVTRGKQNC